MRDIPRRRELTLDEYVAGVRARDLSILPRALTMIESNHPVHQRLAEALLTRLLPHTGHAIRVGITGSPGVGKSTFIESMGLLLVRDGRRVCRARRRSLQRHQRRQHPRRQDPDDEAVRRAECLHSPLAVGRDAGRSRPQDPREHSGLRSGRLSTWCSSKRSAWASRRRWSPT